jgi:uncharacterized protein (TIGR03067 family)
LSLPSWFAPNNQLHSTEPHLALSGFNVTLAVPASELLRSAAEASFFTLEDDMMARCLLLMTVGLLIAADAPQTAAEKEKKGLQGMWIMISREIAGKKTEGEKLGESQWTFEGDTIKVRFQGKEAPEMSYDLDPGKNPKVIDMTSSQTKMKGIGIYKLDGDTLTVAVSPAERPKEWVSMEDSKVAVLVFKRAKP